MTVRNFLFIFVIFLLIAGLKANDFIGGDASGSGHGQESGDGQQSREGQQSGDGQECGPDRDNGPKCNCEKSCGGNPNMSIRCNMFNSDCTEEGRKVCCCKRDKSYCHAWTTATTTTLLSHSPTSSPSPISSLITKTSATSSSSKTLISTSITEMSSPTSSSMTRVPTLMAQTSTTATLSPSPISTMKAESTTASSPLPVQSLITEIEKTSPSSTSPIPTFMRDSSTAAAFPSAVPSTKSPALQSTITQLSSKTTQIPTWKILVSRYSSLIRALNVSNKGSLQEGINATRIFLEDAKKLPPGGNDRNILVATHELESFAIKYGKNHLTAKESAVIVQELFGFVVMKIQRVLENNTEPITCSKRNGTESIVIPSENFKAQDTVTVCMLYHGEVRKWIPGGERVGLNGLGI